MDSVSSQNRTQKLTVPIRLLARKADAKALSYVWPRSVYYDSMNVADSPACCRHGHHRQHSITALDVDLVGDWCSTPSATVLACHSKLRHISAFITRS